MIRLEDIYKIYGDGDSVVRALDGINLHIKAGEYVSIIGKSGSGKSTAMNMIGCLDIPTSGKCYLNGTDVSTMSQKELAIVRNREIGFIFQQYNLLSKLTVSENVELPLIYRRVGSAERRQRAIESLEKVGLADKKDKYPKQLSGGQQQRVSIARALAGTPKIILADEPTGALDSKTGLEVINFIGELNKSGTTIVLITHDLNVAQKAKRIIRIQDGKIISDSEVEKNGD